jgi:hypothetical protein
MVGNMPTTYLVSFTITVTAHTDHHLRDPLQIQMEVRSWMESLNAEVLKVAVYRVLDDAEQQKP